MNKIRSGLPYGDDIIDKVHEAGATVNLAKVHFPTIKSVYDDYKACITYLRNTGFNVELDFSEMNFEQKVALLKAYFDTKVAYQIKELDNTWMKIFHAAANINLEIEGCILNDLELECFLTTESEYIYKWIDFIVSLPLFLILRLDTEVATDDTEVCEDDINIVNFMNIIKHVDFNNFVVLSGDMKPKNYVKVFTLENTELFEAISGTAFNIVLTGILSEDPLEYCKFLNLVTFGEEGEITECKTSEE